MNAKRSTPEPTALLWGEDGRVCCVQHAPYPGSDTWVRGRWRRMRDRDISALASESDRPVECETCRVVRMRRTEAAR